MNMKRIIEKIRNWYWKREQKKMRQRIDREIYF